MSGLYIALALAALALALAAADMTIMRRLANRLTTERDDARQAAEEWREEAVSRAHTIVDLRRQLAVATRQLEAAYDAVGRFSVEAQRQPVRGEGGRFKKRGVV